MNTNIFGKYPAIKAQYGGTFFVIPNGLTGEHKVAAQNIVAKAIESFEEVSKAVDATEQSLLPYVATLQGSMNTGFQLLNWGGKSGT